MSRVVWVTVSLSVALAACGGSSSADPDTPVSPASAGLAAGLAAGPGATEPVPGGSAKLPGDGDFECGLKAPVVSDDACAEDSDCGVSDPCHAKACVAAANAKPPTADTVCTEVLACESADANRCGCFEGHCALIPNGGGG